MTNASLDGQWLDFYALLDVPVGADEDAIRKRIGKVYAEAAAQSDHRDMNKRFYFRALVEQVLPQCRRVLLDPQWRERYDRQHILHSMGDSSAQDYVAFIASMRGGDLAGVSENQLPQRLQEEINAARGVVETAQAGAELELLPSTAVSIRAERESVKAPAPLAAESLPTKVEPAKSDATKANSAQLEAPVGGASKAQTHNNSNEPEAKFASEAPKFTEQKTQSRSQTIQQKGEPARAQVLTAQEAAMLRGRRASNADAGVPVQIVSDLRTKNTGKSRVIVEEIQSAPPRVISPTSLNLMVAITGVLLTITIQRFASTPAIATSQGRLPIYVAVAPEMAGALQSMESDFEKSPGANNFDLIVQPMDGQAALNRAWGKSGSVPDAWIPANGLWVERFNEGAKKYGRTSLDAGASLAQTPLVLIARGDKSAALKAAFPDRNIPSWKALHAVIIKGAPGHFGLSDPQKTVSGTLARASMAREWGAERGLSAAEAAQSPAFWNWMQSFEDQIPAQSASQSALLKDLVLGTTGRFWWGIGYESEALQWMKEGHNLEIWTLPRTSLADHPIVNIERVGAPLEIGRGRAALVNFLRSEEAQRTFLQEGFRPTEISPNAKVQGNPFRSAKNQKNGVRLQGLPRDERINTKAAQSVESGWEKRFG